MSRSKPFLIALFAVSVSLAFSCASARGKAGVSFPIYGMVYDDNGKALSNVVVNLNGTKKAVSDFKGRFAFVSLTPGTYSLSAVKEGMESYSDTVSIAGSGDVLYLKMLSVEGLYSLYRKAFRDKEWDMAQGYLSRAMAIKANDPLLRFALAAFKYAPDRPDRDWADAERILLDILREGYRQPATYLLLADIAQFDKADMVSAVSYLEEYLRLEYSPSVEDRLRKLKEGVPAATTP